MLIRVFLVTTFLGVVQSEGNVTAEVEAFVAKFNELNNTNDVFDSLEKFGDNSRVLFKLGRSAARLLMMFNSTGKATSEEVKALAQLHTLFEHSYEGNTTRHHDPYTGFSGYSRILEYLRSTLIKITNPTERSKEGGQYHVRYVKMMAKHHPFDPMTVLNLIDTATRLGCQIPTKEGIRRLSRLQESLRKMNQRAVNTMSVNEIKQLDEYKKGVLYLISSHSTEENVDELIKNIDGLTEVSYEIVTELLQNSHVEVLNNQFYQTDICLLEQTVDSNAFNQTGLLSKLNVFHADLVRVQLLAWAMTSISEIDGVYYDKDVEIVALLLERTCHFLANWTRTLQNISWPEIGTEFAKREIESAAGFGPDSGLIAIPTNEYNKTAERIQKAFEEHGSSSYAYQVLLLPTSEIDVEWSVGRSDDYIFITGLYDVDVHIFRFNRLGSVAQRSWNAKKRIKDNKEILLKELRHVALAKTSTALSHLQNESSISPIYSEELYRSVILLKKKESLTTKSETPIGVALLEDSSSLVETTRTSYSVVDGGRETLYSWKAFFFL